MAILAMALLFVYGTLKRGGTLHAELVEQGAIFLGVARARGQLFRLKGKPWPGAFQGGTQDFIQGELYRLIKPAQTLKKLDQVEGCKEGLFTRKVVDAWAGNRKVKAWMYFCDQSFLRQSRLP
jgi:gamma-glutamylcyclotransferase (GGCT)/AIG2-like uncharacterized protein YtfP